MIVEERLKNTIKTAIGRCRNITESPNNADEILASAIASAVVTELRAVVVVGVCPTGGGPLTQGTLT